MDDVELRTLILETARNLLHDGDLPAYVLATFVLAKLSPEQRRDVLAQVFEWFVRDAVLDILKAELN